MRRKIEVSADEPLDESAPNAARDGEEPEFQDHVNAPSAPAPGTPESAQGADASAADTGSRDYITALQAELEEARAKAEDAEKRVLYTQAEFQNYRRRREEEQAGLQKYMNREVIVGLLPIVDNFERALKASEQSRNIDALVAGLAGTLKQLQTFLEKTGVKPIDSVGKEFDPNFHEAIGHSEVDGVPANTVAEEVQKGYMMHDRVLRPSLVKVSQG